MQRHRLIIFFFFISTISFAQKKNEDPYKPEWKRDTVIAGNVFKVYNSWVTGGAGIAMNTQLPKAQFSGGVDFNFHITKEYFQTGLILSGDNFGAYNNIQLHICYGKRKENTKFNFAYFGGLAYASFYPYKNGAYALNPAKEIGLYANVQLIRKLTYDVGMGLSAFGEINSKQSMAGIRVDLYFSGAYKGKKKVD